MRESTVGVGLHQALGRCLERLEDLLELGELRPCGAEGRRNCARVRIPAHAEHWARGGDASAGLYVRECGRSGCEREYGRSEMGGH